MNNSVTMLKNYFFLPCFGLGAFVLLWAMMSWSTYNAKMKTYDFPSPLKSIEESQKYFVKPFNNDPALGYRGIGLEVWDSLKLVGMGYGLSLIVAVPLGFFLGASKVFTRCFDPIFQLLRPVSPLAWFPLAGLFVSSMKRSFTGIDATEWQCIFTIAICSVWPTILNTAVGVRAIPQDYVNVARVLKLGWWKRFTKIMLPATLPYMFTGFRLSLGIAWLVIVAAEMLAGKNGIGYFLWNSYNNFSYGAMIGAIFIIGVVGFILDRLMSVLEQRFKAI